MMGDDENNDATELVLNVLDANFPVDSGGLLSAEARIQMAPLLKNENAYELLANAIISPPTPDENKVILSAHGPMLSVDEIRIRRSYRAMSILSNDCEVASQIIRRGGDIDDESGKHNLLLNSVRAGLLAKKLFMAYELSVIRSSSKGGSDVTATPEKKCKKSGDDVSTSCPPHAPHINHLLQSLLDAHPSPVVSAACAGGGEGLSEHLGPMLASRRCHYQRRDKGNIEEEEDDGLLALSSPLPVLSSIVTRGCTGRKIESNNNAAVANQQAFGGGAGKDDAVSITKGHRRKFVRSLTDWGVFKHLVECITLSTGEGKGEEERLGQISASELFHSEASCDAFLSIVDAIGYPPAQTALSASMTSPNKQNKEEESVGEESLLSSLADESFLRLLAACAVDSSNATSETSSRAILGLFELATGRSKRGGAPPPVEDATDESQEEHERAERMASTLLARKPRANKLRKAGVTEKMHSCLVSLLDVIVAGLVIERGSSTPATTIIDGENTCAVAAMAPEAESVRHPGRYVIERPFTSRRLNLVTLLADLLSYQDEDDGEDSEKVDVSQRPRRNAAAISAMDKLMELPLPASLEKKKKKKKNATESEASSEKVELDEGRKGQDSSVVNPWPGLVDLLFDYPENNMYQIQFYRLLHSVCAANHEETLKVLIQKTKFVGRAIDACRPSDPSSTADEGKSLVSYPSLQGVLLRCLNALRLRSQSLSPQSFLFHYLDSHDKWKTFEDTLRRITIEQQIPGGGIAVPNNNGESVDVITPGAEGPDIDIDLGSVFATELGFSASVYKAYVPGEDNENKETSLSPEEGVKGSAKKKKGKKKKKRKKKKKTTGGAAGSAQEQEKNEDTEDGDDDDDDDDDDEDHDD